MSLDTVVEDIRDEARARAEEIRQEGEDEADEIISAAEADADETIEEAKRAAERSIEQEREQKLSSAKLEAKQMRLEARRDVLEDVRDRVEDELATMDGDEREELTRALLDAASAEFDADASVSVFGREDDHDMLETIVEDYDGYAVEGTHECLGGVVVEAEESRVRLNNTFDSILENVWEDNLKAISNQLFDEAQ
jgi:V/A-type H+-transporting ATPase subunit E